MTFCPFSSDGVCHDKGWNEDDRCSFYSPIITGCLVAELVKMLVHLIRKVWPSTHPSDQSSLEGFFPGGTKAE